MRRKDREVTDFIEDTKHLHPCRTHGDVFGLGYFLVVESFEVVVQPATFFVGDGIHQEVEVAAVLWVVGVGEGLR